jgi:hypothetical protein
MPVKELKFKSSVGYDYYQNSYRYYVPTYILSSKTTNDTDDVTQGQSWSTNWTWENTLNYTKTFGYHSFDILAGQSLEKWGNGESISIKNSNSLFPGSYDHAYISNTQGLILPTPTFRVNLPMPEAWFLSLAVSTITTKKNTLLRLLCAQTVHPISPGVNAGDISPRYLPGGLSPTNRLWNPSQTS